MPSVQVASLGAAGPGRPLARFMLSRASCTWLILFSSIALVQPSSLAQYGAKNGEWRSYGGDVGSTKYSPLDQINSTNFNDLEIAWRWKSVDRFISRTEEAGEWRADSSAIFEALQEESDRRWRGGLEPRLAGLKATPLMVGGVLYITTALYQAAAIDAKTGETLWVFNPKSYESGTPAMSIFWSHRGPAYWTDGKEERIFWGTGDAYLIALDARTGRPCSDFGENGRIDLMDGIPRAERAERDYLNALLYSCASPPLVLRDVVVTGSSIADRRVTKESPPGWVRGWDARTGVLKWVFHTIPQEGEYGVETWENDAWKYSGNANVWTQMSGDEELGYVYLPTGTPTNDFYGGHRLGDNLFAESIVCVDVETGERVWHFQTVHHGIWDYDNPAAPNLLDITVDGKEIKVVAQITKQGFTFVFDRVNGEPVWPIEERPVPQYTDLEGERPSPTQPFPTKPPTFEYQGVSIDDLIDFTPELRAAAIKIVEDYTIGPLFTPPTLTVPGGNQGTITRPGDGGGANWTGAAVDPDTGMLYVPSQNAYTIHHFYTGPELGGDLKYTHGGRGPRAQGPEGLPLFKPPYSRITAIDMNSGEIEWMVPYGNGDHIRNHVLLKGLDLPPLGGDGRGGPLLTKTLLIVAQSPGGRGAGGAGRLVALDKATGKELGAVDIPAHPLGTPMTYMVDGRQYIALTVRGNPPELVALRLP